MIWNTAKIVFNLYGQVYRFVIWITANKVVNVRVTRTLVTGHLGHCKDRDKCVTSI